MTYCSQTSFERRLSDRNDPPGSDSSLMKAQNSVSVRRAGSRPFDSLRSLRAAPLDGAAPGDAGGAGVAVTGAAGGGVAATAGACFAHDCGPAAIHNASDPAKMIERERFSSNRLTSQPES